MTAVPPIADREIWQAQFQALQVREKAHTREGDAIAAARRRLPMVEADPQTPVIGAAGEVPFIDTRRVPETGGGRRSLRDEALLPA